MHFLALVFTQHPTNFSKITFNYFLWLPGWDLEVQKILIQWTSNQIKPNRVSASTKSFTTEKRPSCIRWSRDEQLTSLLVIKNPFGTSVYSAMLVNNCHFWMKFQGKLYFLKILWQAIARLLYHLEILNEKK